MQRGGVRGEDGSGATSFHKISEKCAVADGSGGGFCQVKSPSGRRVLSKHAIRASKVPFKCAKRQENVDSIHENRSAMTAGVIISSAKSRIIGKKHSNQYEIRVFNDGRVLADI